MSLETLIQTAPKVELHVHLVGSIRPETVLQLARNNRVTLPADSVEGLRQWYAFTDFPHFIDVYLTVSECIRTPDDVELITREFLKGQAEQHVLYSEVTHTAFTLWQQSNLSFEDQLAAINRARAWGQQELGVDMGVVLDIPRTVTPEEGLINAEWALQGKDDGIVAFGLGGPEVGHPPEKFQAAFFQTRMAGLPSVPHAGETVGPESIWGALKILHAHRIGHGVRCLEDPILVDELRVRQIPLEVCPTSNICLKVFPDLAHHPLPRLVEEGLYVTVNSDDPPMFNTTLTQEYLALARIFHFDVDTIEQIALNAVRASWLPAATRQELEHRMTAEWMRLKAEHLE